MLVPKHQDSGAVRQVKFRFRSWSLRTSRTAGHRGRFACKGRPLLGCSEGTNEKSPAFQRWVGRQKVTSPEGTAEVQSHNPSFSRPFGTSVPCGMFPGVKTPGYSQDVPPGHGGIVHLGTRSEIFRAVSRVSRAILLLLSLPVFA